MPMFVFNSNIGTHMKTIQILMQVIPFKNKFEVIEIAY